MILPVRGATAATSDVWHARNWH